MKYLVISIISILCFSCKNVELEKKETQGIKIKQHKKLIADDFPIPNDFLASAPDDIGSIHEIEYKGLVSHERKWFTQPDKSETIAMELYTDKHRLRTHYFSNDDIPVDLINEMILHRSEDGEIASNSFKQEYFKDFISIAEIIDQKYFKSNKGFLIGNNLEMAMKIYGKPHEKSSLEGVDKLQWKFEGDTFGLAGKENLVQDSFGHEVTMYFRNDLLIGMVLYNAIP